MIPISSPIQSIPLQPLNTSLNYTPGYIPPHPNVYQANNLGNNYSLYNNNYYPQNIQPMNLSYNQYPLQSYTNYPNQYINNYTVYPNQNYSQQTYNTYQTSYNPYNQYSVTQNSSEPYNPYKNAPASYQANSSNNTEILSLNLQF